MEGLFMSSGASLPAVPTKAFRLAAFRARRDRLVRWSATGVTVLTAAVAVLVVAVAAVALAID
jgi:hypothetical protein